MADCAPPKKFELIGVKLKLRRFEKKKAVFQVFISSIVQC